MQVLEVIEVLEQRLLGHTGTRRDLARRRRRVTGRHELEDGLDDARPRALATQRATVDHRARAIVHPPGPGAPAIRSKPSATTAGSVPTLRSTRRCPAPRTS